MNIDESIKKNKIIYSILLFIILYSCILIAKPALIFEKDGSLRHFGIGIDKRTVVPIWLVAIILAIISYLFVLYYTNQNKVYF